MKKIAVSLLAVVGVALSGLAHAEEYVCKVYCDSGATNVTIDASSRSDAADKIDRQSDQICRSDSKGNSSKQTMRPEQCARK